MKDPQTIVGINPHKYDGVGGFKKDSHDIPPVAVLVAGVAVVTFFLYYIAF